MEYDPNVAPDQDQWNALDEEERNLAIIEFHERSAVDLPNVTIHATVHAIVENQIAMGEGTVEDTVERLVREGLDRHEAVHAVGSVLSAQIFDILSGKQSRGYDKTEYDRKLARLTAQKWRKASR